jgi:dCTP deaminase
MILTAHKISEEVLSQKITIEPYSSSQLNPNSYNYRLGDSLIELLDEPIDPHNAPEVVYHKIPEEGFLLHPQRLYLAHTLEKLGSRDYVMSLIGRSSMGRLGLWLQVNADLGHAGTEHHWTLELCVVQPLWIYPRMIVGQVSFWEMARASKEADQSKRMFYQGKYAEDIRAEPSHIHVEFAKYESEQR